MTFHIVGLDLSLAKTGWAIIRPEDTDEPIRVGVIESASIPNDAADKYPLTLQRLRRIASRIVAVTLRPALTVLKFSAPAAELSMTSDDAPVAATELTLSVRYALSVVLPPDVDAPSTETAPVEAVAKMSPPASAVPVVEVSDTSR